jgi:hypothetical protein
MEILLSDYNIYNQQVHFNLTVTTLGISDIG